MAMRAAFLSLFMVLALNLPLGLAQDAAKELSARAQHECDFGRRAAERNVRLAHFEKGEALAEQAVTQNDQLADAHFALFCNIGEQMRIDGESMTSLRHYRRMMKALDRTLELDPNHLGAMSSKGTFLVRLPMLMGGDVEKGEQMLRTVVQRDPKAVNARLALAKIYASRGRQQEAMTLAMEALDNAKAEQRTDMIPEAQATIATLRGKNGTISASP